jgi:nucleotide-binding universal stress UspA family protein
MTHVLKRILVAVDDSPSGRHAVDEAVALAADEDTEVVFAHVISILGEQFVPGGEEPERVPSPEGSPSLTDAEERAQLSGVRCTKELLVGYPPKQLALLADDLDADLIVVGSRHLRGLKRALLGSTSRALLSESTRPVLVVPYVAVDDAVAV